MIRLSVRCDPALGEIVLAELLALAPGGVEETSGDGWIEYSIYGAPSELPELGDVEAAAGEGFVSVRSEPVAEDWSERWREFHRPAWVDGRIVVRPPWIERREVLAAGPPAGETPAAPAPIVIVIEPAQAFGTGAHPTTRLCLRLLLELADEGIATGELTDVGAGSGVLAIAAVRLGFKPVTAYDNDPASIEAIEENARRNGPQVESRISSRRYDLRTERLSAPPTLLANLTAPLLEQLADSIDPAAKPKRIVCSGLLREETERVANAFAGLGFEIRSRRELGDWAGLRLEASNQEA